MAGRLSPAAYLSVRPALLLLGTAGCLLFLAPPASAAPDKGGRRSLRPSNATGGAVAEASALGAKKALCSANLGCQGLSGDCCPASNGMMLSCCSASEAPPTPEPEVPGTFLLPMEPSCDHLNVGFPNCGEAARCQGEYGVDGSTRTLTASSDQCAYVTFKTSLTLNMVKQLDAEAFIAPGTCSKFDNLAFWFFQTVEDGDAVEQPTTHWDAFSEVDLFESYIGPGGVDSVNTNFAATGIHVQWTDFTIVGGMRQHITMWTDPENAAGCPATRTGAVLNGLTTVQYGKELPVVSIYVAHCAPGAPCCSDPEDCRRLQSDPTTARGCITVKDAPLLFALSNWGAGHVVTKGCQIGVSDVTVRTA